MIALITAFTVFCAIYIFAPPTWALIAIAVLLAWAAIWLLNHAFD